MDDCALKQPSIRKRMFDISNIVALGCIQGGIVSAYLFRQSGLSRILSIYVALIAINMAVSFYIDTGLFDSTMSTISTWRSINSYLLLGPLLFAFMIKFEQPERKVSWFDVLHLAPFFISFIWLTPAILNDTSTYLITNGERLEKVAAMPISERFTLSYLLPAAHFITYILICSWRAIRFWLKTRLCLPLSDFFWPMTVIAITYLVLLNTLVVLLVSIIVQIDKSPTTFALANLATTFGFFALTYLLIHRGRPKSISQSSEKNTEKNLRSVAPITIEQQQSLSKLEILMTQDNLFLDSELTQSKLAEKLRMSRHQLSELLALHPAGSFYELINQHRIRAVVHQIKSRPSNIKLSDIAYDCGFNSKSNFNQVFKKQLDQTPSQFRNSVKTKTS